MGGCVYGEGKQMFQIAFPFRIPVDYWMNELLLCRRSFVHTDSVLLVL